MTVDQELVDNLRNGDVVRFRKETWSSDSSVEGPIQRSSLTNQFYCCDIPIVFERLDSLEVVKRAPRPYYTNADHTAPSPGDVAAFPSDWEPLFFTDKGWITTSGSVISFPSIFSKGLTLLYRQP